MSWGNPQELWKSRFWRWRKLKATVHVITQLQKGLSDSAVVVHRPTVHMVDTEKASEGTSHTAQHKSIKICLQTKAIFKQAGWN